jgi:F-type H+-transporting ATPase subunit a
MNARTLAIFALALASFVIGFIFFRGPIPHIAIAAEELFTVGPIKVTNTMVTSWFVVAVIIVFVFVASRRWTLVPQGLQNFVEAVLEAFYNLVVNVAGEHNGRRFFPVVATIFFYVVISNWMSLTPMFKVIGFQHETDHGYVAERAEVGPLNIAYIPLSGPGRLSGETIKTDDPGAPDRYREAVAEGKFVGEVIPLFRGPNTDLNTPLALALVSAIAVQWWGISTLGLFAYGRKFINFGAVIGGLFRLNLGLIFLGIVEAFVGILELASEFVRLVSFTFRLFGNMFAGQVVILMFTFLTPLVFTLPFYGLELFIGLIQGLIFAMLTLVFGIMAVSHAEAHGAEEKHGRIDAGQGAIEEGMRETVPEPAASG